MPRLFVVLLLMEVHMCICGQTVNGAPCSPGDPSSPYAGGTDGQGNPCACGTSNCICIPARRASDPNYVAGPEGYGEQTAATQIVGQSITSISANPTLTNSYAYSASQMLAATKMIGCFLVRTSNLEYS